MKLSVVILAAGQGKRMKSDLPKVLQPLAGRPLLKHVIDVAQSLEPASVHVVYGHGGERVREHPERREGDVGAAGGTARHGPRGAAGRPGPAEGPISPSCSMETCRSSAAPRSRIS